MCHTTEKPLKYQEFTQTSNCENTPYCPYRRLESIKCIKYDSVLQRAICQGKGNQYSKVIRCCLLPSWVPNGFHLAKLISGHLRAPYVTNGTVAWRKQK